MAQTTSERLQRFLARSGVASRRAAERLIASGRVQVNGVTVREMGLRIDPSRDTVCVDGNPVEPEPLVYIAMDKPAGCLCTVKDPQGRPTVMDLVGPIGVRIFPAGRLDLESEGLLVLTNDGGLALRITHPRHGVPKVYQALVAGRVGAEALEKLRRGVRLEEGVTSPAQARILSRPHNQRTGHTLLEITLREGWNRQVRRMCAAVGHPVKSLRRVQIGRLHLKDLRGSRLRRLSPGEVNRFFY